MPISWTDKLYILVPQDLYNIPQDKYDYVPQDLYNVSQDKYNYVPQDLYNVIEWLAIT